MEYLLRISGTRSMGDGPHCRDLEKQWGQSREGPSPKGTSPGLEHPVDGQRITMLEDNASVWATHFLNEIHWGLFGFPNIVRNKALGAVEGSKNSCAHSYS